VNNIYNFNLLLKKYRLVSCSVGERGDLLRTVAILLIAIGIIGIVFIGRMFSGKNEVGDEVRLSAGSLEHIVVDGELGNINVMPSNSNDIEIHWEGSVSTFIRSADDELVSIKEHNNELKISTGEERLFNFSFLNFNVQNKLKIDLYLPDKEFTSLVVKNDVGNTDIKDIHVENLTTKTDVANVTLDHVTAGSIVAETDVGNLNIKNVHGKLFAKSDVGNITIHSSEIEEDMTLSSDVGKIRLSVPNIPDNVSFNANSSVGSVRVFGEKGSYISKNSDYIVSITTDVGNINVDVKE